MVDILQGNYVAGGCKEALPPRHRSAGFTLMELSIVLVIISLVVAGIVVGQDLIQAGLVRAQVTQLERYSTAMNVFKEKYGFLPGDIPASNAATVGLVSPRYCSDGNGVIKGYHDPYTCSPTNLVGWNQSGEPLLFWRDLSDTKLIDQTLNGFGTPSGYAGYKTSANASSSPPFGSFFPTAKVGKGGMLYVWSGGPTVRWNDTNSDGNNYMSISAFSSFGSAGTSEIIGEPSMTAGVAYGIDLKIDDGNPQTGRVQAFHLGWFQYGPANGNAQATWAAGNHLQGTNAYTASGWGNGPSTAATPLTQDTCYDNGNTNGATQHYSIGNTALNCAISMRLN